jgi:carboxynorspermidine decarboxylase
MVVQTSNPTRTSKRGGEVSNADLTSYEVDTSSPLPTFAALSVETPAFVYDESRILAAALRASNAASQAGCKVLYSLKSFAMVGGLRLLADRVAGFAASSVFEARLARQVLGGSGQVHANVPAASVADIESLNMLCDYITLNSLSQWSRLQPFVKNASCGLRLNPQLSLVADPRYDPCRIGSKLGVTPRLFTCAQNSDASLASNLRGIHFHSNCDSEDLGQLYETTVHLSDSLGPDVLERLDWINLGGGYLFVEGQDISGLTRAVELLTDQCRLEVFIEPGASIVRDAGNLIATILDIFSSDGHSVAVLDTSVNHLPEVFEYEYAPEVVDSIPDGAYLYTLAGNSCLAGDLFGQYAFAEPLAIGGRVVFRNVGAYSIVRANTFNGIGLPAVYALTQTGQMVLKRRFTYEDFSHSCGVGPYDRS